LKKVAKKEENLRKKSKAIESMNTLHFKNNRKKFLTII